MQQRTLLLFMLIALLVALPARADQIGVKLELWSAQGTLLYTASAYIVDPGVEFKPYNQLSFDFTGGDVSFRPLVSAYFTAYDAIFTVITPQVWFGGVSPLGVLAGQYSVAYDPAKAAIIFHHAAGADTSSNLLSFHAELAHSPGVNIFHSPEPSSLVLLGTGLIFTAGVLRRRWR